MKVVSEQLGHSSLAITADTYTSVLPAVAHAAAEAVAGIVPRAPRSPVNARTRDLGTDADGADFGGAPNKINALALSVGYQRGSQAPEIGAKPANLRHRRRSAVVRRQGLEPRTR